jgi:hypothetical protein
MVVFCAVMSVPVARLKVVALPSPLPTRKLLTVALKFARLVMSSVARPVKDAPLLPWRMSAVALALFNVTVPAPVIVV